MKKYVISAMSVLALTLVLNTPARAGVFLVFSPPPPVVVVVPGPFYSPYLNPGYYQGWKYPDHRGPYYRGAPGHGIFHGRGYPAYHPPQSRPHPYGRGAGGGWGMSVGTRGRR